MLLFLWSDLIKKYFVRVFGSNDNKKICFRNYLTFSGTWSGSAIRPEVRPLENFSQGTRYVTLPGRLPATTPCRQHNLFIFFGSLGSANKINGLKGTHGDQSGSAWVPVGIGVCNHYFFLQSHIRYGVKVNSVQEACA